MTYRPDIHGRGMALSCDKTTTGAWLITSLPVPNYNVCGYGLIRKGDKTTPCPACGKPGMVAEGEARFKVIDIPIAVDGCVVHCGCPEGSNRIIAPLDQWMGAGPSPAEIAQKKQAELIAQRKAEREAEEKRREEERERNRVFAKSCLRGEGCNDAGDQREPHTNFAPMGIYQAVPQTDPVTDTEAPQRAQMVKKKKPVAPEDIPKPKKRSALWKWWNGHHEEMDYQRAVKEAERAQRARAAIAGASVLRPVAGNFAIRGTWAVVGETAIGVAELPLVAFLIGMMPGRLNDGEQDFIDRMRAEQAREVPTRVRFTWETNSQGNPVPHGWHTPPGQDRVRVRRMEWDGRRQAYTFTTEEEPRITLIWTPDNPGIDVPNHTGNQYPPVLPNPVMVDPLPDDTGLHATTSPAPEEKDFADYILILPFPDIPPIYIYLSKPPVEFLEVELYSNFKRRSRQGKYEADHMPSRAAVDAYLRANYPLLDDAEILALTDQVAAIVVPKEVHQRLSETYGRRNTPAQIELDSRNLRAAVDRNLDAIKPALKEHGATEGQIEAARAKMHKLNSGMGLYK